MALQGMGIIAVRACAEPRVLLVGAWLRLTIITRQYALLWFFTVVL